MATHSLGGSLNFVTFMVDYSKKCWAYLLKDKTEVFTVFRNIHAFITVKTGFKLKYLKDKQWRRVYQQPIYRYLCRKWNQESLQLYTIQHQMEWLNDTVGQYVKEFDVCCQQLISLMHFGRVLYKLLCTLLIDSHTIHSTVAY